MTKYISKFQKKCDEIWRIEKEYLHSKRKLYEKSQESKIFLDKINLLHKFIKNRDVKSISNILKNSDENFRKVCSKNMMFGMLISNCKLEEIKKFYREYRKYINVCDNNPLGRNQYLESAIVSKNINKLKWLISESRYLQRMNKLDYYSVAFEDGNLEMINYLLNDEFTELTFEVFKKGIYKDFNIARLLFTKYDNYLKMLDNDQVKYFIENGVIKYGNNRNDFEIIENYDYNDNIMNETNDIIDNVTYGNWGHMYEKCKLYEGDFNDYPKEIQNYILHDDDLIGNCKFIDYPLCYEKMEEIYGKKFMWDKVMYYITQYLIPCHNNHNMLINIFKNFFMNDMFTIEERLEGLTICSKYYGKNVMGGNFRVLADFEIEKIRRNYMIDELKTHFNEH